MDEKDIIEVEVLSETASEAKPSAQPKKNVTYLSKADRADRLFAVCNFISRFITPAFFLFAAAGLTFSILYSQGGSLIRLIFMLVAWSIAGLALITSVVGFFIRQYAHRLLQKDSEGK